MKYLTFLILFLGLPLLAFAQTTTGAVNTDTSFVPLTNIPFLTETGNSFSLDSFLNGLYRISIGIAAVVAVLQIMRAGIMYMGSDSGFAEKKEAKNLIALSIGGLILVLSPVVVFSVINPEILNLKIENIEKLKPIESAEPRRVIEVASASDCREQGGVVESQGPPVTCSVPADSDAGREATSCATFNNPPESPIIVGGNCALELSESYVRIDNACCAGIQQGNICCGKSESSGEQAPRVFLDQPLIYYSYQEYDRVENKGRFVGVVPNHAARVTSFRNACTAAGREVETDRDD
ncbi:MAG: pilin, partial [bacterium]|nr:pilin [bacterium]